MSETTKAEDAWPLSLDETQRIVGHLTAQGTREGLILGDLLNRKMGASARRRAFPPGGHPPRTTTPRGCACGDERNE